MDTQSPELWRRIKQIASAALDLEPANRRAFVETSCDGDAALLNEVLTLIASTEAATPFFERAALNVSLFSAGSRLGPYRLVRELGSGGMGSVYLAERDDGQFNQRVAIKIVRGGFANSFLLRRFYEERQILASLQHPNIARLVDGGATETGLPYVVMEFVEGEPIDRFCARHRLGLRERLIVFQQVCAAVEYAHQHLVVHRDIKAANILVTHEGVPKLLDFGIAKLLDRDSRAEFAQTTVRVMTPESASPEQVSGQPITVATDIYALGVLLYRLLTGQSPYRGPLDRDTDLIRAVCEEDPERPSGRVSRDEPRIPADVDMIVLKALRKEPERRYRSAEQFAADVQRFLDRRPVLASPDSVWYRTRKFVVRRRVGLAAAAALVLTLAGGVGATVWQARAAERERARAERNFDAVRGLAGAVMGELSAAVAKLPGSTAVEEILLRRSTEYLDALAPGVTDDAALRSELAHGYLELSQVQGSYGLNNLGDHQATRATLFKAIGLLEPVASATTGNLEDRLTLALCLVRLTDTDATPAEADAHLARSRAIMEAFTPFERTAPSAIMVEQALWSKIGAGQQAAHDFQGARISQEHGLEAALRAFQSKPTDLHASRNLSLQYKQLGATLQLLGKRDEALTLFHKALDLDRARVAAEPGTSLWQLDLSFAEGSIGALLEGQEDAAGARTWYESAVAHRLAVVNTDPNEDFAKTALARGYERLAEIHKELGDVPGALDLNDRRVEIFRGRLAQHPDRLNLWHEYADVVFNVARKDADWLLAGTAPAVSRARGVSRVSALLDELERTQARWLRERLGAPLPPAATAIRAERDRLQTGS
jgi:non-specific serine/threonine protein kinase/serine/threonine-protein kinase